MADNTEFQTPAEEEECVVAKTPQDPVEEVQTQSVDKEVDDEEPPLEAETDEVDNAAVVRKRKQLADVMRAVQMQNQTDAQKAVRAHKFWDAQPVPKHSEDTSLGEEGPIDELKKPSDIRQTPLTIPDLFYWCECDMKDPQDLKEVYELLHGHYVEDGDNLFRFDYAEEFLQWALLVPGYRKHWHVGVRAQESKKLVAFITATPVMLRITDKSMPCAEVNFLCVHKKLRRKRLAPVLIKEITRRVNLDDIWQAIYTAGTLLPKPVAQCQYYHRALDIKKLVEVKFSMLGDRLTMSRAIRLYKLPAQSSIPGLRPLELKDIPAVNAMNRKHLESTCKLWQVMTDEEAAHTFLTRENVVYSFVVEKDGEVTDFLSFYSLPSSVIGNDKHKKLHAAYAFYFVANGASLSSLMEAALILARDRNFDVFNALDLCKNESVLRNLKFGMGDGSLRFYLYNWRTPQMKPSEVGIVLV